MFTLIKKRGCYIKRNPDGVSTNTTGGFSLNRAKSRIEPPSVTLYDYCKKLPVTILLSYLRVRSRDQPDNHNINPGTLLFRILPLGGFNFYKYYKKRALLL